MLKETQRLNGKDRQRARALGLKHNKVKKQDPPQAKQPLPSSLPQTRASWPENLHVNARPQGEATQPPWKGEQSQGLTPPNPKTHCKLQWSVLWSKEQTYSPMG